MADRDDLGDDADEEEVGTRFGAGTFLAGLAIGAGLALLLAPRTGAQLRRDMGKRARRARRAAEDMAGDVRERAVAAADGARTAIEARVADVKDTVVHVRDSVADAVDSGRDAARSARAELERRIASAALGDRDR